MPIQYISLAQEAGFSKVNQDSFYIFQAFDTAIVMEPSFSHFSAAPLLLFNKAAAFVELGWHKPPKGRGSDCVALRTHQISEAGGVFPNGFSKHPDVDIFLQVVCRSGGAKVPRRFKKTLQNRHSQVEADLLEK